MAFLRWLCWWRPPCVLRLVIVNVRGEDTAIRGVLWSARGAWLVLVQASLLKAGEPPLSVDGQVVIHRSAVLFLQVMP